MPENETQEKHRSRFREIIGVLMKHEIIKGLSPEKLRHIVEDLGPTYIKLGQILSMHSDMLPKEYCEELAQLRSNVAPMPYEQVCEVIYEAYGEPIEKVFQDFKVETLGAASIAQVHKATLVSGEDVVVKVQRQGIYDTMQKDIVMLHRATKLLRYNSTLEAIDFDQILDEMWNVAQQEMNFLIEAASMEEFRRLNQEIVYVATPKLYRQYTTSQILVMEYIEGYSVDDKEGLLAAGYDLDEIGGKLADNYMKQILEDGFFHADPHTGNIRVRDGKIIWLDMGMMGRLTSRDQTLLSEIVNGIAQKDANVVKDAFLSLGEIRGRIDHHRLYMDIDDILTKYATSDLGDIEVSRVLEDLLVTMKNNKITLPSNMTMLVRGLATAEGVVAEISPDTNVISVAAAQMNGYMWRNFDMKKLLKDKSRTLYKSASKAIDIPGQISDLLHMQMKGQTRISLDLHATEDLTQMLKNLVRNLVLGILVAALLIGSSIVCMTDMRPKILGIPAIGVCGFIAAVVMMIWLLWEHRKPRK